MKYIYFLSLFTSSLFYGQNCEEIFENIITTLNNFKDCQQTASVAKVLDTDLKFVSTNCPIFVERNQKRLSDAGAKYSIVRKSLQCENNSFNNYELACDKLDNRKDSKENYIGNNSEPKYISKNFKNFTEAIYKTAESLVNRSQLEDVTGYDISITFTVKKDSSLENIRFSNSTSGIASTPRINTSILSIIRKLESEKKRTTTIRNGYYVEEDVTIKIDLGKYMKAYFYRVNLNSLQPNNDTKKVDYNRTNEVEAKKIYKDEISKKSTDNEIYKLKQNLIRLIDNSNPFQRNLEKDTALDKTEQMDYEAKKDYLKLLTKPGVSMSEISNYISKRIKSVSRGLRGIWEDSLRQIDNSNIEE